jgi:hypothetical protein
VASIYFYSYADAQDDDGHDDDDDRRLHEEDAGVGGLCAVIR